VDDVWGTPAKVEEGPRARDFRREGLRRRPPVQLRGGPTAGRMVAPASVRRASRALGFIAIGLLVAACGGGAGGGAAALALGKEAVVEHAQISGASPGPKTTLGITVLAVRTGTIAELEAGGYEIDADQQSLTPYYVDVRFENKGSQATDRHLWVSLEDQDGNLISAVTIFNYGGEPFAMCPDNGRGELAPGDAFETCTLFLVQPGRKPTRVSFLPYDPGKETDFVYWSVDGK